MAAMLVEFFGSKLPGAQNPAWNLNIEVLPILGYHLLLVACVLQVCWPTCLAVQ
jgi:hypothetical protein